MGEIILKEFYESPTRTKNTYNINRYIWPKKEQSKSEKR